MSLIGSLADWTSLRKDWAWERVNRYVQHWKAKEEKTLKNGQDIQNHGTITKDVTCDMGIPEGKAREKHIEEIFEAIMTENFSQINVRQNTNPGETWRI